MGYIDMLQAAKPDPSKSLRQIETEWLTPQNFRSFCPCFGPYCNARVPRPRYTLGDRLRSICKQLALKPCDVTADTAQVIQRKFTSILPYSKETVSQIRHGDGRKPGDVKYFCNAKRCSWLERGRVKDRKVGVGWNRSWYGKERTGKNWRRMGGNTQTSAVVFRWQRSFDAAVEKGIAKTGRDHGVIHHELTERL